MEVTARLFDTGFFVVESQPNNHIKNSCWWVGFYGDTSHARQREFKNALCLGMAQTVYMEK
jgi:hypothetical protein